MAKRLRKRALCGAEALDVSLLEEYIEGGRFCGCVERLLMRMNASDGAFRPSWKHRASHP